MPSLHGPRMVFLIVVVVVVVVVLGFLQRETNESLRFVRTGDNQDFHHFIRHCKTPGPICGRHCARRGASALSDSSKPAERRKNISTLTSERPCVKKRVLGSLLSLARLYSLPTMLITHLLLMNAFSGNMRSRLQRGRNEMATMIQKKNNK